MRLAVIGVGLIGGSFALALKKAGKVAHVVGVGRNRANLDLARERGIVDSIAADAAAAARDAEVILVAAPVAQFAAIFTSLSVGLKAGAVVTDAGSTKRDVVAAARAALGAKIGQFVPAHPVAGAEKSGAAAASAELFSARRVVLTPLEENAPAAVAKVQALWEACGARITWPTRWCTTSRSATTRSSCSRTPPAASAISRASPRAIPRCGAISASPIAIACWPSSAATRTSSPALGACCRPGMRLTWRSFSQKRARRATNG